MGSFTIAHRNQPPSISKRANREDRTAPPFVNALQDHAGRESVNNT
jgi:hypothetical protein